MRLPNLAPWGLHAFYAVAAAGVAAGAALALWGALQGYPYWFDELYALVASQGPAGLVMQRLVLLDVHPPLYYGLLAIWAWLFGTGEVATRTLSLLGALGALGAVWWMGGAMLSRAALALASLWLATHWMWITFAQEARMYGLVLLGGVWLSLGFARLWNRQDDPPPAALYTFALVSVPVAFLHYSAMVLLYSALLLLLWRHRRRPALWPPLLLAGSPCALWSLWHLAHMGGGGWIQTLSWGEWSGPAALLATLWTVFFPGRWYGFGDPPSLPLVAIWLALSGIYAFFAVEWWRAARREGGWTSWKASVAGPEWSFLRGQLLLLALFFAVLSLGHHFRPILVFKMLVGTLPATALCLGCLAAVLWSRAPWRLCAVAAALLAVSLPVAIYGVEKRWARELPYDREGLLKIAAQLEGGGAGMPVHCVRCQIVGRAPRPLFPVVERPPGAPGPVRVSRRREGDLRHLVPPFFLYSPSHAKARALLVEQGFAVRVLTPDGVATSYRSLYVPALE